MVMKTCNSNKPYKKKKQWSWTYFSAACLWDRQRFVFAGWSPAEPVVLFSSTGLHHHISNTWRLGNTWKKGTIKTLLLTQPQWNQHTAATHSYSPNTPVVQTDHQAMWIWPRSLVMFDGMLILRGSSTSLVEIRHIWSFSVKSFHTLSKSKWSLGWIHSLYGHISSTSKQLLFLDLLQAPVAG